MNSGGHCFTGLKGAGRNGRVRKNLEAGHLAIAQLKNVGPFLLGGLAAGPNVAFVVAHHHYFIALSNVIEGFETLEIHRLVQLGKKGGHLVLAAVHAGKGNDIGRTGDNGFNILRISFQQVGNIAAVEKGIAFGLLLFLAVAADSLIGGLVFLLACRVALRFCQRAV